MPRVTAARAVAAGAAAACLAYAGSCRNGWAFDDEPIISANEAAHSTGAALDAFFSPYWPASQVVAGQYRPLTILTFGIEWSLVGDRPAVFHAVNVLLHGAAVALLVLAALAWLPPLGALLAGLVFAVHPVHVEAVANVVGRAEVLVAVAIFAMVLAARRHRAATSSWARGGWMAATLAALAGGLLAKEHAAVGIAVLALDEALHPPLRWRRSAPLYLGAAAVTAGWFYLWFAVAGGFVAAAAAEPLRRLTALERVATMAPVQLEVLRLLVWPFDLSSDYNPIMVPQRTAWSWTATVGLASAAAVAAIGLLAVRRAPAVAFGIIVAILSYAPTSNILFGSGVVLAERNLYLAAAAPALAVGWLATYRQMERPAVVAGLLVVLLAAFSLRTAARVTVWRDSESVLIEDGVNHPENYRARLRVGSFLRAHGDLLGGLAEATAAGAIFPGDPWVALHSVPRALDAGLPALALREARRAVALEPAHPSFARLAVRAQLALGQPDSALPAARRSVQLAPASPVAAASYVEVLDSLSGPPWQRWLATAEVRWRQHRLGAASAALDSGMSVMGAAPVEAWTCWDLGRAQGLMRALRPDLGRRAAAASRASGCPGQVASPAVAW